MLSIPVGRWRSSACSAMSSTVDSSSVSGHVRTTSRASPPPSCTGSEGLDVEQRHARLSAWVGRAGWPCGAGGRHCCGSVCWRTSAAGVRRCRASGLSTVDGGSLVWLGAGEVTILALAADPARLSGLALRTLR
ncbi:hypothetical protein [Umezawaea beigongshangensis]|uniref:hypothetical protein n=1 Tax=Umezawaea beigongshangensis TaxID=2780383 RepID=UPI0018F19326|nr:hypothetical protein [Umezawaea beigongshangensis]